MEGLLVFYGFWLFCLIFVLIRILPSRINTFSFSESAKAKNFTPIPDRGVVFVYRPPRKYVTSLPVLLSGRLIAKLRNRNFIRLELPEGDYSISGYSKKHTLNFHIKNGEVAFIKQSYAWYPGPAAYTITYFDNQACKTISGYYLVRPYKFKSSKNNSS